MIPQKHILGAHNCMSFSKPLGLKGKLFNKFAKCQSLDPIVLMQEYGVRCFDIRVGFDDNGDYYYCHGSMKYKKIITIEELCMKLKNYKGYKVVRLILENNRGSYDESYFISLCEKLQTTFTSITFIGGRSKKDWKLIYPFHPNDSNSLEDGMIQYVGSMMDDADCLDKVIPIRYAKSHNKKNFAEYDKTVGRIGLFDFIELIQE